MRIRKAARKRIDEIDEQQKKALLEKKESAEAIGLLLYSNEIQQSLRYFNTLEDALSAEKVNHENLRLSVEAKENALKQIDTKIEKLENAIDDVNNQINLLRGKKGRIDYTTLIKEPTASLYPVSPAKKSIVFLAGFLAFLAFTMLAFFLEYLKRYNAANPTAAKKRSA